MHCLLLALTLAAADAGTPAEFAALRDRLAGTRTLTAKFTQKRTMAALKDALETHGTFSYDRSGKMRWQTAPPAESELVLEGTHAVMRYPALGTEQAFDLGNDPGMTQVFESILAVLQADLERLEPHYTATVTRRSPLEIELAPKNPTVAKMVERINLSFDKKLSLTSVVLREYGGDRTEIAFRDHVVNGKFP